MDHVAVDLGSKQSHFCVRSADGKVQKEARIATAKLGEWFLTLPQSRIILETCAESFLVADAAKAAGHEVRVVPSTLAPSLGVGQHGVKTDKRDCRALSMASCRVELGSVHIPSKQSREWKALCMFRDTQVQARTKLINTVRGWLRGMVLAPKRGTSSTFPKRVRELLAGTQIPDYVQRPLEEIELLTKHIQAADKEVEAITDKDEVTRRLMTVPGVGPITALRFRATVDDVKRFKEAHLLQSYLGLTPGEDSSSTRERRTSITRAGPAAMRWTLVQAAWVIFRRAPESDMGAWALRVAQRRNRAIAAVALARKLAGVLFAIWRDGTTFKASMKR